MNKQVHNTTSAQPLVSVVMPVFNAKRYLKKSIDSILKQTYTNWQLIIVDDGSKDGSRDLITHYQDLYPKKIKAILLPANLNRGGDVAANIGIQKAKGMYIAKMDADDIAHPTRLEKQVEYLTKHQDVFMVGTNAHVINAEGTVIGEKKVPLKYIDLYNEYIYFHPMIHPSVMFRNENKGTKKDFYRIKYPLANDYYTFFSLICEGKLFANLPEKLLYYRIDGKNASLRNIKKGLISNMHIKLEIISNYNYPVSIQAVLKNIAIFMTGMLLPQRISFYLYMLSKNIITLNDIHAELIDHIQNYLASTRKKLTLAFGL